MIKMCVGETLKFTVKVILPLVLAVIVIFLVILYAFPTLSLTFEEFTIIYWSLSIVAFPLNYQAGRWTDYVTKRYGIQREMNPVMRNMLIKGNLKVHWIVWLGTYLLLYIWYIIAVYLKSLVFLIFPLLVMALILYDFLNDFFVVRKLKKESTKLENQ
jgi:hypothetical protein